MFGVRLKLFILLIIAAHAAVFDARAALTPDESEPRPTITEAYHHVAFTAKEGAPSGIGRSRKAQMVGSGWGVLPESFDSMGCRSNGWNCSPRTAWSPQACAP